MAHCELIDALEIVTQLCTSSQHWHTVQVVKVMRHKAALAPHTDSSVVFTGGANVHPHLIHPNRHLHHIGSAPCWLALSIFIARHVQACPGPTPFAITTASSHLHVQGFGPPSYTWFLGPTWVSILNGITIDSAIFARLTVVTDRQTMLLHL